ncbi:MAG: hypothetical protein ACJAU0_000422 [Flavobacteriales bacterium]|jgi:hypothetical protein
MKDLGTYLILLSTPFFALYLISIVFLPSESQDLINSHLLALAHLLHGANVYFLWSRFYDELDHPEVLDTSLLLSSLNKSEDLPAVLTKFLFPLGFLISIGTLTYMTMYIVDHTNHGLNHWFGEELLVTFILACSIPATLISIPFYFQLMNRNLTQNH